jgi:hypothetical protein
MSSHRRLQAFHDPLGCFPDKRIDIAATTLHGFKYNAVNLSPFPNRRQNAAANPGISFHKRFRNDCVGSFGQIEELPSGLGQFGRV